MTKGNRPRVFISATYRDLGRARQVVKQALENAGCTPVEWDGERSFDASPHWAERVLSTCQLIIHIVGRAFGSTPDHAAKGGGLRSFAQTEYDVARRLRVPMHVLLCDEKFPYDGFAPEAKPARERQQEHRRRVQHEVDIPCTRVKDFPDLTRAVLELAGGVGDSGPPPEAGAEQREHDKTSSEPSKGGATTSPFRPTYAAFETDLVAFDRRIFRDSLKDSLGVEVYASHLAQLIVARKTPLPLSLGLFGDWGAGKSFFMRLLHQEIETLSTNANEVFCRKVVQIHFNAWHYLDTNLWANLVCEIFDNLFSALIERPDTDNAKVEALRQRLAEQSALAEEARKALTDAKQARSEADKRLQIASQRRQEQENSVAAFMDDLQRVVL